MQDIVQTVLQKMGNVSKPQLKVWTILLKTILVLYGKVNYTNMSRYSSLRKSPIVVFCQSLQFLPF